MKKYHSFKRFISFGLAAALMLAAPISSFTSAAEEDMIVETSENIINEESTEVASQAAASDDSDSKNSNSTESGSDKETSDKEISDKEEASESQDNTSDSKEDASISDEDSKQSESDDSNSEKKTSTEKELNKDSNDSSSEKDKDKKKEETDSSEEKECEHDYEYKTNEDGTHVKTCKLCQEEITEDCEYDEKGACIKCGFEKPQEIKEDATYEVELKDFLIKAVVPAGAFDEDVEFKVDPINLSASEKELVDEATPLGEVDEVYAFDIRFEADGKELEPKEGYNVKISIESSKIEADVVVHIKDDNTAEKIDAEITEEGVEFEADSFSIYAVTGIGYAWNSIFYDDKAYGSGAANARYAGNGPVKYPSLTNNRIALRVLQRNSYGAGSKPKDIIPGDDENKYFVYSTSVNDTFTFTFVPPTNYYVASVSHYEIYSDSIDNLYEEHIYPNNKINDPYFTVDIKMSRMKNVRYNWLEHILGYRDEVRNVANVVVVDLEPIPTTLTSAYTYVEGATFVNYDVKSENGRFLSDNFAFTYGGESEPSNKCDYWRVYQDLAARTMTNGVFTLAQGNKNPVFPKYEEYEKNRQQYSYITNYYNQIPVQFNYDEDGYWTLDSSKHKYIEKNGKIVPDTDHSGDQFRPFKNETGNYGDHHFGMYLPIKFNVARSGKTKGKDTIFKFSGDDDVFVYVDDKLVLDLGGIHDIIKGQINFATGEILIQGDFQNKLTSSVDETVYTTKGIGNTNLYKIVDENNVEEFSESEHILTVVYFERGANLSNCKISYNFLKTETRTADFTGLKVDENHEGLAGAEFTLYTDEACTQVATIGVNTPAVATSDDNGTIKFAGLAAGYLEDEQDSVSRTYYLKETKAPEGYNAQLDAKWQLDFTAYREPEKEPTLKLTALNDEAAAFSLDKDAEPTRENVKSIVNILTKHPKTLSLTKKVTNGFEGYTDTDANYIFTIAEVRTGNDGNDYYIPLANQPYKIGDTEYTTNEWSQFALKAGETAVFENLMENKYKIEETYVLTNNGYSLDNYQTKVTLDGTVEVKREAIVAYDTIYEKSVEFENILNKVFDWQLVKVSTSGKTLQGGEFTLAEEKKEGSTVKYYGKSGSDGVVKWYTTEDDRAKEQNPIVIPVGNYTLSETKAPSGYAMSTDVWHVTIDRTNGTSVYMNQKGDLQNCIVEEVTNSENGATLKTVKLSFANQVAYTLPETGGRGIFPYTISGVLMMIGAALLLYKRYKCQKS